MSIYEEHQLLRQLEKYAAILTVLPCEAQRLRRKLLVRQVSVKLLTVMVLYS